MKNYMYITSTHKLKIKHKLFFVPGVLGGGNRAHALYDRTVHM
jgi:hypothetical protein